MKKRIFSILLCLCMVLMLCPVTALANDDATALQALLNDGGTVTLDKDYTIDTTLEVTKTVTLDLNGYVIRMTGNGSVIKVSSGGELTLTDSRPTETHTGDASLPAGGVITSDKMATSGGGVYVDGGSFTMEGGTIYNCFVEGAGGGVFVGERGSFTMNGGAIKNCYVTAGSGGGVFVGDGSFTMSGGVIEGCYLIEAHLGGEAVACNNISSITANGGVIKGEVDASGTITNTSDDGRCTEFHGEVTNGGTISGGIYYGEVTNKNKGTISGGIYYGKVSNRGTISGGFYYNSVMNYGTISGGIYYDSVYSSEDNISGKTVAFVNDRSRYALEVVADGKTVVAPIEPEAPEGMTFAGWYTEETLANKYEFGKTIFNDLTLYAGFEPVVYTLTVPFTTTVKLGGSAAPGETTFELALVDSSGNDLKYDDVYFGAVVTTDGAGDYDGELTITAPLSWLYDMLYEGAFIWQYDDGEEGWTYDDTVWGLQLDEVALASIDDTVFPYPVLIYPTYIMDDGSFDLDLDAGSEERMSFTNTYTYSAPVRDTATIIIGGEKEESKPVEENPNTGAPVAANMSTLSVLVLASAVAVLKTRKH